MAVLQKNTLKFEGDFTFFSILEFFPTWSSQTGKKNRHFEYLVY